MCKKRKASNSLESEIPKLEKDEESKEKQFVMLDSFIIAKIFL